MTERTTLAPEEQATVPLAAAGPEHAPLRETHRSHVPTPAQLRELSLEHAAIALMLSFREHELVIRLGRGLRDREIGEELGLSANTVQCYVQALMNRTALTRLSLAILGYELQRVRAYV